jgi:hypothetical protein
MRRSPRPMIHIKVVTAMHADTAIKAPDVDMDIPPRNSITYVTCMKTRPAMVWDTGHRLTPPAKAASHAAQINRLYSMTGTPHVF